MNLLAALAQSSIVQNKIHKELSTGLSLLNYSLSGDAQYGIDSGSVIWVSGSSNSGRTTFGLTILAEAAISRLYDSYSLVYFDTEGKSIDVANYLGKRAADRIWIGSVNSLESFWEYSASAVNRVIVLDSLDGLMDEKGWQINNSYAKGVFDCIHRNGSILIIIAQQKFADNKKVTAGGFAPVFYSDFHLRLTFNGDIYETRKGTKVSVGSNTTITPLKSKFPVKRFFDVPAPVIVGSGYDNAESLMLFLRKKEKIRELNGEFYYPEFGCKGDYKTMLRFCREYESILVFKIKEFVEVGR